MAELHTPNNPNKLSIRAICESDSDRILSWRNNSDVRKWSRNKDLLSRAEHDEWFRTWLLPSNRRGFFFIVEELNMPIGMVRFDSKSNQIFEISVIIDPNQQNRGFAKKAIGLALQEILSIHEYFEVAAAVNSQNHPSISLFSKLGFQQEVFEGEFLEFRRSYTRHDFDE